MVWRTQKPSNPPTAKMLSLDKNEVLETMLGEGAASSGVAELVMDRLSFEGRIQ